MRNFWKAAFLATATSIGCLAPPAHAATVVGFIDLQTQDPYLGSFDAFPSLGRLDRVRIDGRVSGSTYQSRFDPGLPVGTYNELIPTVIKFANFTYNLNLPGKIIVGATASPSEFNVSEALDVPVSFVITRKNSDLSGFYLSIPQIMNGESVNSSLDVIPQYLFTVPNFVYGGSVKYDYDLTNSELEAAGIVPEPATWAMMLVGFGMVGFGLRRRTGKVTTKVAYA